MKKNHSVMEYVLTITLITIFGIFILKMFGGYITDFITKSTCNLANKVYKEGNNPGEGSCIYTK